MVLIMMLAFGAGTALADPPNRAPQNEERERENPRVTLEEPGVLRMEFIDYVRPLQPSKGKSDKGYMVFAGWPETPISYVVNPTNPQGLSEEFIETAVAAAAGTWDAATPKRLFSNWYGIDYTARSGVYDGMNTLSFGDLQSPWVIAEAITWVDTSIMAVAECDIVFNTESVWGDATADGSSVMDLQNIATHEIGHGLGLADIYSSRWSYVTMYGYAGYGEANKRSLERPDITGLRVAQ